MSFCQVPDELPPPSEDFVDLDQHTSDYMSYPSDVKVKVYIFIYIIQMTFY